jgi:hypothetical protein
MLVLSCLHVLQIYKLGCSMPESHKAWPFASRLIKDRVLSYLEQFFLVKFFLCTYYKILISHHFGVEIFFVYNSRDTEALVVFHVGCRWRDFTCQWVQPVLALFTLEYNFTFYIFFRALGTQIFKHHSEIFQNGNWSVVLIQQQ